VELQDGVIRYKSRNIRGREKTVTIKPTDVRWREFRQALDGLGVWKWRKSYLFFLTIYHPGIGLTGDRVCRLGKYRISAVSGAFRMVLEKSRERFIRTPGREGRPGVSM
jgi:hypothetical protein